MSALLSTVYYVMLTSTGQGNWKSQENWTWPGVLGGKTKCAGKSGNLENL